MSIVAAFLRSVVFEIVRLVLTVVFAVISLLTFAFEPLTRYRIITTWSRLVIALARAVCGVEYRVIGRDNLPAQSSIVLSKHQSAWETLAYQGILPPQVWVLKRELLLVPFFGLIRKWSFESSRWKDSMFSTSGDSGDDSDDE